MTQVPLITPPLSGLTMRQCVILAILLLVLVVDGMDVGILSVVASKIIAEWGTTKAAFGVALSAAPAGMAVGSVIGGWLGDRLGRKMVVLLSILIFGVTTALSALTTDVSMLAVMRLFSGIGFGAASPAAIALAAEWVAADRKARTGSFMSIGAPLGVMMATWTGLLLVGLSGWRGTFVVFGLSSLVFAAIILLAVPESPGFLRLRNRAEKARRLEEQIFGSAVSIIDERPDHAARSGNFFAHRALWRFNLGAWLAFLASSYTTYAMASWLPVILQGLGFAYTAAVRGLFFMTFMALIGTATAGFASARFGSRGLGLVISLAAIVLTAIFAAIASGSLPRQEVLVMAVCAGIGLTQGAIAGLLYGLVSARYPIEIRSTGIGIGLMVAKVGGVLAVLVGGRLLDRGSHAEAMTIATFTAAAAILFVSILLIDRHIPWRDAKDSS